MSYRACLWAFAAAFALPLAGTSGATYRYTLIAQANYPGPNSVDYFNGLPVLNDAGQVAFISGFYGDHIYVGSGGPLTTIVAGTPQSSPLAPNGRIDINDAGYVAFQAMSNLTPGFGDIVASNGVTTKIIYHDAPGVQQHATNNSPAINNAGYVAFYHGDEQIAYGNGSTTTDVGSSNGIGPLISDSNQVVYGDEVLQPNPSIRTNGGKLLLSGLPAHDMNRLGHVAYVSGNSVRVINADGTNNHFVMDVSGYHDVGVSINDLDHVVISAGEAGNFNSGGVFTGPDPVTDAVIRPGDSLFGSVVVTAGAGRHANNDSGSVVFRALLEGLHDVIARADPIPEPGAGCLVLTPLLALRRRRGAAW